MGNKTSQNQNINSLASEVDDIALNYILTQNTIDLLRLTDKEYYDNLIILTSSVIEKRFNSLELGFLQQRIFGKQNDAMDIVPASNKIKEQVIFNISKFYIKIIMIYGAIATTIDPQYSYEVNGVKKTFYLKEMSEYKNIPRDVTPELVNLTNPMNLCRKRLSILKNKLDPQYDEHTVKLNPGEQLCALSSTTSLTDEVGIKELDLLYFDIFDYETKTWSKRSAKMKQKYNKDLTLFYQIFTGKVELPESITSFNDIELLDLSTIDNCSRDSFKKDLLVSNENRLVKMYQDKIKLIEQSTQIYRSKLVNLLKELFLMEEKDGVRKRIINPKLTLDHILIIENDTRDTILNLYTSCEKYFIQALILFEKIYDEQIKTLNENRVDFIDGQGMNYETPEATPFEGFVQPDFKSPDGSVETITPNFGKEESFLPMSESDDSSREPSNQPSNSYVNQSSPEYMDQTVPSNAPLEQPTNASFNQPSIPAPNASVPSNTPLEQPTNASLNQPAPNTSVPSNVSSETPVNPETQPVNAVTPPLNALTPPVNAATQPVATETPETLPATPETLPVNTASPPVATATPETLPVNTASPPVATASPETPPVSNAIPPTPPVATASPPTAPPVASTVPPVASAAPVTPPAEKGFFSSIFSSSPDKKVESENPPSTPAPAQSPAPTPAPSASPSPAPSNVLSPAPSTPAPTTTPAPSATPAPTPTPAPTTTPAPAPTPAPSATPSPTPTTASPAPTPASPAPTPSPSASPSPPPSATPAPAPTPQSSTFTSPNAQRPNAPKINKIL